MMFSVHRNSRVYEQLHLDNAGRSWDHQYILDERSANGSPITRFYFDELYLFNNASLQLKTGDNTPRSLECYKIYGDASGRIYLQVGAGSTRSLSVM